MKSLAFFTDALESRYLFASFGWVHGSGGAASDGATAVAAAPDQGVYVAGMFNFTSDFQPGSAVTALTSAGRSDIFIARYSPRGKLLWAQRIGGKLGDHANALTVDSQGNLLLAGSFAGKVDLDPGPNTFVHTSMGERDSFVLKLSPDGKLTWVSVLSSLDDGWISDLDVDSGNNPIIGGAFAGKCDFNPTKGVYTREALGEYDAFLVQLSVNGKLVWVNQMGPEKSDKAVHASVDGVDVAPGGNVFISGNFSGPVDLHPSASVATKFTGQKEFGSGFVQRLTSRGEIVWTKAITGPSSMSFADIAVDPANRVYLTGHFYNTVDFDPGPGTYNLKSFPSDFLSFDGFVMRLESDGAFFWARQLRPLDEAEGAFPTAIAIGDDGSVNFAGSFLGSVDFNPTGGEAILTSAKGEFERPDLFVARWSPNGKYMDAIGLGSKGFDDVNAIAIAGDRLYAAGYFGWSVDFAPGARSAILSSAGDDDWYLLQLLDR